MTRSPRAIRLIATVRRMALPVLIVGLSIVGAQLLIASRPTAPKVSRDVKPTSVEVLTARVRDERAMLTAYGTVQAHRRLTVQPEVSGRVVRLNPHVVIGGIIPKGAALLQIDPRDYRVAVDEQRAALAKAEFDVKVELGNQAIARREWDLLNPSAGEINALSRQLALRRPHLREKLIGLAAARSRLRKARLDLRRTIVRAPLNALVLTESVETGQLVTAGAAVATLVGTDEFRVQVSVPLHQLSWITFPKRGGHLGSPVQVIRDLGNGRTPAPGSCSPPPSPWSTSPPLRHSSARWNPGVRAGDFGGGQGQALGQSKPLRPPWSTSPPLRHSSARWNPGVRAGDFGGGQGQALVRATPPSPGQSPAVGRVGVAVRDPLRPLVRATPPSPDQSQGHAFRGRPPSFPWSTSPPLRHSSERWNPGVRAGAPGQRPPPPSFQRTLESRGTRGGPWSTSPPSVIPANAGIQGYARGDFGEGQGQALRTQESRGGGAPRACADQGVVRQGTVVELLGDVTQNGRMAQILVSVRDPLELEQAAEERQPLLLGEYVRVAIEGPLLRDVTELPRHAIREGSRVWIKNAEQQLEIRPVDIVLFRQDTVLVGQGIRDGDEVIISHVPAAVPGLSVQRRDEPPSGDQPLPPPLGFPLQHPLGEGRGEGSSDQTGTRPSQATGQPLAVTKDQPAADPPTPVSDQGTEGR